ncbi:MAG: S-adenosylmethionine synthetase N-terminal domain-containing protein [Syntrophomonadaceae bacterium]|nr:S-adenosylmethionine synthetase N-terminal domain-containing protein [Syntrophomonadaceae bacterium]
MSPKDISKVCDQTANRLLDALLAQDPFARVACEVTVHARRYAYFGGDYR